MSALPAIVGSPEVLEQALARAPASVRAQFAWTPKRLRGVLLRFIEAPVLSHQLIEECVDQYLDAIQQIRAVLGPLLASTESLGMLETRLAADAGALESLRPVPRAAAIRSLATITVLFNLSRTLVSQFGPKELSQALESPQAEVEARTGLRGILMFSALVESMKTRSKIPGRAAALALRADQEFQAMAQELARHDPHLRLPWYFENAPGSEQCRNWGAWRKDVAAPDSSGSPPSQDELDAWEEVKESIDANRPERPVFG